MHPQGVYGLVRGNSCLHLQMPLLLPCQVRQVQRLLVSLEAIDRNALTVSRAHLGSWSFPGLGKHMPKLPNMPIGREWNCHLS